MKAFARVAFFAVLISSFCLPALLAQGASPAMEYHLSLRFAPESNLIAGKARISAPSDSCFYLSSALDIQRVSSDGKAVRVHSNASASVPGANEICIESGTVKVLEVEYSGRLTSEAIRRSTTQTNMVEARLIELSNFLDWYPRMRRGGAFRYKLETDLPAGFVTVTNGRFVKEQKGTARTRSEWESFGTGYGITLVAAPQLKKAESAPGKTRVEIYYDKLPQTYVDTMLGNLSAAMQRLQSLFGAPGSNSLVRVVYSPRGAGGYARAPLFLVSESFALEQLPHRFGLARDLRLNIHEMAHYWSRADTGTVDDWINEGLAEFAALLVSEQLSGQDFADQLVAEYEEIVNKAPTTHSVLDTEGGSWESNVNRYYKPALLLNNLRKQHGDAGIQQFLRTLNARFSNQKATTAIFLEELEKNFGQAAREQFADGLARTTWAKPESPKPSASVVDPDYLGTWTGVLMQSGTPYAFVLHLKSTENLLVATLDSPDQNVKDIPVQEVQIAGDTLTLKVVGVAPASYRARIDRANHALSGEWAQMGVTYQLNLTRTSDSIVR